MASVGIASHVSAAIRGLDGGRSVGSQDDATLGTGPLHRLLNRTSALDRIVGDAGPLGKYRTDAPDAMPSGTSSLTLRTGDALNRLAARLGMPGERILAGNPAFGPQLQQRPQAELPAGVGPSAVDPGLSAHAPRPAVATDADNSSGAVDRGNRNVGGA
jgi:hypothetical protein